MSGERMNVGFISLGCAKNLVDSEMILGMLSSAGAAIVNDPEDADVIFINTCGFIEAAKEETIDTIREMKDFDKKLIVTGCYAKRYEDKILNEMPFVDKVISLDDYPHLHEILAEVLSEYSLKLKPLDYEKRMLTTSVFSPYVKIAEGCDNHCAFCAIPLIRGHFHSRPMDDILNEVRGLIEKGAKEINLISQDTTRYGFDLTGRKKTLLPELLKKITAIKGLWRVRFLYLYPDEVTDELLDVVEKNKKIATYFDIPLQHISDSVLKKMHRRDDETSSIAVIRTIKEHMPDAIIRSTFIVGFPGETEADFEKLRRFVEAGHIDRLGVFTYSREEDTPAYKYGDDVPEEQKQKRKDILMATQRKITRAKNKSKKGTVHETLVEAYDPETGFYYGRSEAFAPDDVDGCIVFQADGDLSAGDIVSVEITDQFRYDLIGDMVDAS